MIMMWWIPTNAVLHASIQAFQLPCKLMVQAVVQCIVQRVDPDLAKGRVLSAATLVPSNARWTPKMH